MANNTQIDIPKTSNSYMTTFFILIIIILIICLISFFFIKFSKMSTNEVSSEYEIITPLSGNAKNMNLCPSGCYRGVCKKGTGQCNYDFQCEFCADSKTNNFYVEPNNNMRQILPLYEEENKLNNYQKNSLNELIYKNNNYINQLNKKIESINA